jgi:PEP-CTERM motif
MKMKHNLKLVLGLFASIGSLLNPTLGHAQAFYHVNVTTASLIGNASGPFSLDFQLNDGSGSGDGNNTATLNNFTFGGGSALGSASLIGGATGNLTSGITLSESAAFNEFYQGFTPGTTLGFDVALSANLDAGLTPDLFGFAILDSNLANIPTTGFADSLLLITINGVTPTVQTGSSLNPTGVVATVPEPSTLALAVLGLAYKILGKRKAAWKV